MFPRPTSRSNKNQSLREHSDLLAFQPKVLAEVLKESATYGLVVGHSPPSITPRLDFELTLVAPSCSCASNY